MSSITLDLLDSALHSVEIKSASGQALSLDGSGYITANVNGTVAVSATDLDIRALTSADVVSAVQSGTWNIGTLTSITNDVNIADGGNSITIDDGGASLTVDGAVTVSASDLDIRDLVYTSDSVTAHQGGTWAIETVPGGFASWKVSVATVDTTVGGTELVSTPLSSRLSILVQNLGSQDVYIKEATGVTTANGAKLPKGSSFEADLDDGSDIFAIAASGSSDVRIIEYAA